MLKKLFPLILILLLGFSCSNKITDVGNPSNTGDDSTESSAPNGEEPNDEEDSDNQNDEEDEDESQTGQSSS